jgi:hypothetical protein
MLLFLLLLLRDLSYLRGPYVFATVVFLTSGLPRPTSCCCGRM